MDRLTLVLILSSALIIVLSGSVASQLAAAPSPVAPPPLGGSCAGTIQSLTPCLNYVRKKEDKPSRRCCDGAKKLNNDAKTKEARQAACECIKQGLKGFPDVDPGRIQGIPQQCGISATLPPIDRNFDCSTVSMTNAGLIF